MPRKRDRDRAPPKRKPAPAQPPAKSRPGLPNPDSVVSEDTLTSPKGNRYRIITTTQADPYDPPLVGKKRR
jgi:hypothetical protein